MECDGRTIISNLVNKRENEREKAKKKKLSQATRKKVNKFMGDLTSLMDDIFEREEDDNLPQGEKATCQKLLLTISIKENLFTEEQRNVAKMLLERLEGREQAGGRRATDKEEIAISLEELVVENGDEDARVGAEDWVGGEKMGGGERLVEKLEDDDRLDEHSGLRRGFFDRVLGPAIGKRGDLSR